MPCRRSGRLSTAWPHRPRAYRQPAYRAERLPCARPRAWKTRVTTRTERRRRQDSGCWPPHWASAYLPGSLYKDILRKKCRRAAPLPWLASARPPPQPARCIPSRRAERTRTRPPARQPVRHRPCTGIAGPPNSCRPRPASRKPPRGPLRSSRSHSPPRSLRIRPSPGQRQAPGTPYINTPFSLLVLFMDCETYS